MTTDVTLAKLASIERCLERIRSVTRGNPETIDDIDVEEIVVLNLQRAIQATSIWRRTSLRVDAGGCRIRCGRTSASWSISA